MENIPVSKIHRLKKPGVPFKNWIEGEKELFHKRRNDGRSAGTIKDMDLETFINHRHRPKEAKKEFQNASGKGKELLKEGLNILQKAGEKAGAKETANTPTTPPVKIKKTILGMQPIVFYSATGAILIVTSLLIYKMVKK